MKCSIVNFENNVLQVQEIKDDVKYDLNEIKRGNVEDISDALFKDYQKRKLVETM